MGQGHKQGGARRGIEVKYSWGGGEREVVGAGGVGY